jgi:hypothetical protein
MQKTDNQTQQPQHTTQGVISMMRPKKQFGVVIVDVLLAALILTVADVYAQIRQFAQSATASSEYHVSDPNSQRGTTWSAREMIGAPDQPKCGDIRGAWAASTPDRPTETIDLRFVTPVYATQLNVYETNVPGSITRVEFINEAGTSVVQNFSVSTPSCPRIFTVNASTPFLTNHVRLTLDTSRSGYEEIDAVELVGTATPGSGGGGNNGGNNGGNPGGGQVNRAPNAPTLQSPAQGSANHNAAAINFQFSNNGDADGDTVTFYLNIFQYNSCTERWTLVFEGRVGSAAFQLTNFAPGTYYAWRVFAMDEQKRSTPWFTASNFAVFSTAVQADIIITVCTSEGIQSMGATKTLITQASIKGVPDGKPTKVNRLHLTKERTSTSHIQITARVFTVSGQLVSTADSESGAALALTGLANGIYLVVVEQKHQDGRIIRTVKPVAVLR